MQEDAASRTSSSPIGSESNVSGIVGVIVSLGSSKTARACSSFMIGISKLDIPRCFSNPIVSSNSGPVAKTTFGVDTSCDSPLSDSIFSPLILPPSAKKSVTLPRRISALGQYSSAFVSS